MQDGWITDLEILILENQRKPIQGRRVVIWNDRWNGCCRERRWSRVEERRLFRSRFTCNPECERGGVVIEHEIR